jgi:hypothetical protein
MARQMRIALGELLNQFGLDHVGELIRCGVVPSEGCQHTEGPSSHYP